MQEQNAIQTMIAMIGMKHLIYDSRISKNNNPKNLKMYYLQRVCFVLSFDVCLVYVVTRCIVTMQSYTEQNIEILQADMRGGLVG